MQPYSQQWLTAFAQSNGDQFTPPYNANLYTEKEIWRQIQFTFPEVKGTWALPTTNRDVIIFVQYINDPDVVAVYQYQYVNGAIKGGAVNLETQEIGQLIHESLQRGTKTYHR
jgi:hypothetical protein